MKKLFAAALSLMVVASVPTMAAAPMITPKLEPAASASSVPNPASNATLAHIQSSGAKLYFMGSRMGMNGWFVVMNNQVQIVYTTPDNKGALVGAMFGEDGENISVLQLNTLVQTNKEVANLMANLGKEQAAIAGVGSPPSLSLPQQGAIPAVPASPGERLFAELALSPGVAIGDTTKPELLMVMDTHCKHCQAAWKSMKPYLDKGLFHVRMIPTAAGDTDSERSGALLLTMQDPRTAWEKYVSGDKSALEGTPSAAAIAAVKSNMTTIDNWKIEMTPYFVYKGAGGKVKIVQGEPNKWEAIIADLKE